MDNLCQSKTNHNQLNGSEEKTQNGQSDFINETKKEYENKILNDIIETKKIATGRVYVITNNINNKKYIGITSKSLNYRFSTHKANAKRNLKCALHHAIRKYGIENFSIELIKEYKNISLKELWGYEKDHIQEYNTFILYNNGYNMTLGGDSATLLKEVQLKMGRSLENKKSPMHGKTHTQESIDKQKQAAIGRFSLEWFIERNGIEEGTIKYNNRREKLKTRKMNYSHDNGLLGTKVGPMSDENKRKISESKKAFKLRKPDFFRDLKSGQYTIEKMAELYNTSKTLVKYYKRKR